MVFNNVFDRFYTTHTYYEVYILSYLYIVRKAIQTVKLVLYTLGLFRIIKKSFIPNQLNVSGYQYYPYGFETCEKNTPNDSHDTES